MPQEQYYVTLRSNGKWAVIGENAERAVKLFDTKSEAEKYVRTLKSAITVTSQDKDGKFKSKTNIRNKKNDDGNCYLTTACVSYYNLTDNCKQLTILRNFRDTYLATTIEGYEKINRYYLFAPKIVKALNNHKNKKFLYQQLFSTINIACDLIEQNKLLEAEQLYISISEQLYSKLITK